MDNETVVKTLLDFSGKKFSDDLWKNNGLIRSEPQVLQQIEIAFKEIVDNLIDALESNNCTKKTFKTIFKQSLHKLNQVEFDTEEKEFICDLFFELGSIVDLKLKNELINWLYGPAVNKLLRLSQSNSPKTILETKQQPCSKCGIELKSYIVKKEEGLPDNSWLVARCDNCGELNLVSNGPDISEVRFGNYRAIDNLRKDEYTYEEALTYVEKLRNNLVKPIWAKYY